MKEFSNGYFQQAKSWADDLYVEALASRNRYRFALLICTSFVLLLAIAVIVMIPLQHTQLILIHHHSDGTTWTELVRNKQNPVNQIQINSDIVRYVTNRESYSPDIYDHHYALVNLLSSNQVAKDYQKIQSIDNPKSQINTLKNRFIRKVHIENILMLNKDANHPMAEVNFETHDHDHETGREKVRHYSALISWQYRGTPKDPEQQWQNWNGFTVTHYSSQEKNLG